MNVKPALLILFFFTYLAAQGQQEPKFFAKNKIRKWYEKISFGGYMQVRYHTLETNQDLGCEQCDEAWGNKTGGLSLRRLRFKFYGQINPRVFMYIQPDFAKSVGESHHVARVKDAYFDIGLDKDNVYRIRIGQSKVPFGYENMQSSSKRLPLDRNDAINSGLKDERDMGVFFYWATKEKRQLMHDLKAAGLKHSGDFGVFAFGIYNGQTANHLDQNNEFHIVSRLSYPISIGHQLIESGLQAYAGNYVLQEISTGVKTKGNATYTDQRVAASFVLYPKPFGIQAEYNIGRGPEFDKETDSVEVKKLQGGYVTFSYMLKKWNQVIIPFTRIQYYDGGKKNEPDARSYTVKDIEAGIEWQPLNAFELTAMYTLSDRRYEDFKHQHNHQKGSLLRLQAQLNF